MMDRPTIKAVLSDITTLDVDCIVNAANKHLIPGGGVCGAIHKAAGLELRNECKLIGFCAEGKAVITRGYNLKAKYVVHAVGPQYLKSDDPELLLAECYKNSLLLAEKNNVGSIAFPSISTGVFGYPIMDAASIATKVIQEFDRYLNIKNVVFCCFDEGTYAVYKELIK